jgi:2-iminoacetate synthase
MKIAKTGKIQDFCQPNALLTLTEYMQDYASPETREIGEKVIEREGKKMSPHTQKAYEKKRQRLLKGERDLYF